MFLDPRLVASLNYGGISGPVILTASKLALWSDGLQPIQLKIIHQRESIMGSKQFSVASRTHGCGSRLTLTPSVTDVPPKSTSWFRIDLSLRNVSTYDHNQARLRLNHTKRTWKTIKEKLRTGSVRSSTKPCHCCSRTFILYARAL